MTNNNGAAPQTRDIVVIGGSAGALEGARSILSDFPPDVAAAFFLVIHSRTTGRSFLPEILTRATRLQAEHFPDGEPISHGRVYIASPNHHLLVKRDRIRQTRGPREHGYRPSVDVLFRTAAETYGPRVTGVVLSGSLDDGAAGIIDIVENGGCAVVHNPEESPFPGMPQSAIDTGRVHHVLSLDEIPGKMQELIDERVEVAPVRDDKQQEPAEFSMAYRRAAPDGMPSGLSCPQCSGGLWEMNDDKAGVYYRCRTGHGYSEESFLSRRDDTIEDALWFALAALREKSAIGQRLAGRSRKAGRDEEAVHYQHSVHQADTHAAVIGRLLQGQDVAAEETDARDAGVKAQS